MAAKKRGWRSGHRAVATRPVQMTRHLIVCEDAKRILFPEKFGTSEGEKYFDVPSICVVRNEYLIHIA